MAQPTGWVRNRVPLWLMAGRVTAATDSAPAWVQPGEHLLSRHALVKILTLLKCSLDVSEIKVDPASRELRLAGVPLRLGNIDRSVVEAAVRLKETHGAEVLGLSYAPPVARDAFRDVLAMGLDEVSVIADPSSAETDAGTVVSILEAAIRRVAPFDLVLCGFSSDDGYSFQIGPRVAERLDLPLVSYVRGLTLDGGELVADRDLDDCIETVRVRLPAVISIAEEAFLPRRTTLMDALKAKKKTVNVWSISEGLGLSVDELASQRRVVTLAEQGVVVTRKRCIFKGQSMPQLADALLDALLAEGVLGRRGTTDDGSR